MMRSDTDKEPSARGIELIEPENVNETPVGDQVVTSGRADSGIDTQSPSITPATAALSAYTTASTERTKVEIGATAGTAVDNPDATSPVAARQAEEAEMSPAEVTERLDGLLFTPPDAAAPEPADRARFIGTVPFGGLEGLQRMYVLVSLFWGFDVWWHRICVRTPFQSATHRARRCICTCCLVGAWMASVVSSRYLFARCIPSRKVQS
jgi:hypothetical protein